MKLLTGNSWIALKSGLRSIIWFPPTQTNYPAKYFRGKKTGPVGKRP